MRFRVKNTRSSKRYIFSLRSVLRGYKKDRKSRLYQLSFKTQAYQDMSLGAEELNWGIQRVAGAGSWQNN
jgi:hypothetical protein